MRRQHVAVGAGALALCLGGLLAVGGDGGGDKGFVAVGAAGTGSGDAPTRPVPPESSVELFPLDAPDSGGGPGSRSGTPGTPGTPGTTGPSGTSGASGTSGTSGTSPGSSGATGSDAPAGTPQTPGGRPTAPPGPGSETDTGSPKPPAPSGPPPSGPPPSGPLASAEPPASPAALSVGAPVRAKTDRRWCEKVTVRLHNTGGTAVRSGGVTFRTHIIGALGVDWGARTSTQPLPGRIGPGEARNVTYTVCVDAWRVPLGMRVETRKVSAAWQQGT
ncbi:hypothetical protein ACIP93_04065 [Streptomyces sp. NPDC088745]|uniref:hypothetical protein n=1 Tax=Streptomyces sp. NPDC088745 TaxID=3365884 RepID=UPI00380D995F